MTTLAAGSSVTLTLANNGFLELTTNGGFGSVTITPTNGVAVTESWGPGVFRKRYTGPFPEGATAVLTNSSSSATDYKTDSSNLPTSVQSLVAGAVITADDTGSVWTLCPALLSFSVVLTAGTSTTVLLEVRDSAGTVSTAATIVADTTSQTLRSAFLTREAYEYRFRRSSGTGTVSITL